jgi:hypothetical protein
MITMPASWALAGDAALTSKMAMAALASTAIKVFFIFLSYKITALGTA